MSSRGTIEAEGASKGERLRGALGVSLVASVLTLVMAAPLLLAPATRLFGSEIVGRHEAPFIVIDQFESPRAPNLYTQPATDYPGAAVAAVTGDGVSAYNIVVLASFPMAALFAYLLAYRLTRSRLASWLASLLYAFAPFHIAQSAYHPHGAQIQWLPLYLLALWLCLERVQSRRLVLLGIALALVALSNFYYGLIAIVLTPFALLGFWWVQKRTRHTSPPGFRTTLLALAAMAVAGLGYVATRAPAVLDHQDQLAWPRSDLGLYGAQVTSYLIPPVEHPLLGARVRQFWETRGLGGLLEQQITLGLGMLVLAAIGLVLFARRERDRSLSATPALALIGGAAFVFSLAPGDGGVTENPFRPAVLLYEILPMFRAYARFGVVVFLMTAILASAACARLLRGGSGLGRGTGLLLLTLTLVELMPFPPFRWRDVLPTSAHRFLDDQDRPVRLLDCGSPSLPISEHPVFVRFRHSVSLRSASASCGDPGYTNKLAHEGFTHLLVRRPSALAGWLETRSPPPGARLLETFPDALLYTVDPPLDELPFVEVGRGFHWREFRADGTHRWMGQAGTLPIMNPGTTSTSVDLELEMHAFPEPRTLTLELDGTHVTEFMVNTQPDRYSIPGLVIEPGRHSLVLRSTSPAVVADRVLGNGDTRALSVALWGWEVRVTYDVASQETGH